MSRMDALRLLPGLAAFTAALLPVGVGAAENERCPRLVAELRPLAAPVSFRLAAKGEDEVRLTFIGHATFLIESPAGVRIATDYNDYVRPTIVPDIITMNRAHSTHYTHNPEPSIKHVLRGWATDGEPARHDFKHDDVWVRSVPTNIRDWGGGTVLHGNSIFVFEVAGLCIAHLGHLHHTLTPAHIDELGRIDVVLVPVDGTFTLGIDGMVEVLQQIKPPHGHPHAHLRPDHTRALHRAHTQRLPGRVRRNADCSVVAREPAATAEDAGAAGKVDLDVHARSERVLLNECAPRLDHVAHELSE